MKTRGVFQRLYDENDGGGGSVLPPAVTPPTPAVPEPRRAGYLTCDGCGCALDTQGKIIRRGDGLKAHLDREEEVANLRKELDQATTRIAELDLQVSALTPKKRKSILM